MDTPMFDILLTRGSAKPDAAIGFILSEKLGIPATDATTRMRYGGGLVAEDVTEALAEELLAELEAIGVQAQAFEAGQWRLIPRGYRASGFEFLDDVLLAQLAGTQSFVLFRDEIVAVNLHGLRPDEPPVVTGDSQLEVADLPQRARDLLFRMNEKGLAGMDFHLTIYCEEPVGPVRVQKSAFQYECLGDRKHRHSLENFLRLVDMVLDYLPNAWNRARLADFLDSLDPESILFFKPEEAQNFDRWMHHWIRMRATEDAAIAEDTEDTKDTEDSLEVE